MGIPKHYLLTVSKIVKETQDAISIHFAQPKLERIQYKPGQYVMVRVEIDGNILYRPYSISTTLRLDETLGITVKRVNGGMVSNYLHDHIQVGNKLEVVEPKGQFTLINTVKSERHIVFVAAGSGISPIMSMLRSTLFDSPKSKVSLIYANKDENSIIFYDQLVRLYSQFSHRFKLIHVLSQSLSPTKILYPAIKHIPKRLDESLLRSLISYVNTENDLETLYYVCAPESLMALTTEIVTKDGVEEECLFKESFHYPIQSLMKELDSANVKTRQVAVFLRGQSFSFTVPPGMSVLDAGLAANVNIPYSCRAGECLTCMGKLIQGNLQMSDQDALTKGDREKGYRLLCQSVPLDDEVIIEIGNR